MPGSLIKFCEKLVVRRTVSGQERIQ